jgi:hypothetical protein
MANTLELGNGKWATGKDTVLAFNDQNNNFKPLPFSFSRDTSGTIVNKDGLIETVGSGEPRIDFKDNTKGALLLEPERSNVITYSNDFTQSFYVKDSGVSISSENNISPSGILNATKINVTDNGRIYANVSSNTYYSSVFIKAGSFYHFKLAGSSIDLINETNANGIIENYGNGWFRVGVPYTGNRPFQVQAYPDNTYSSHTTLGNYYIWGGQVEAGSYPTSYIPTSGGVATRVVDTCIQTVTEGIVDENEMTLYCELEYIGGKNIIAMSVHNNSNSVIWLNIEADLTVTGANFYGGFYGVSRSTTSLELNNKYKIAYRTKNGDSALYINGILEASSTETIANPNILNKVQLGGFWTSANTEGNFKIIDAKCYNSGLSNSELQALTQ